MNFVEYTELQKKKFKVERRQAGKKATWVGKLFHLISQLSQFYVQPARTWQWPVRSHYHPAH